MSPLVNPDVSTCVNICKSYIYFGLVSVLEELEKLY
jgi:hypothetical protein